MYLAFDQHLANRYYIGSLIRFGPPRSHDKHPNVIERWIGGQYHPRGLPSRKHSSDDVVHDLRVHHSVSVGHFIGNNLLIN